MKKVLVIRFSSIGDIVLTTPVIRALKLQTDAHIHILTKSAYKGLFDHNPHVDYVHHFKDSVNECLSALKKEEFEHVVDLQKNVRSLKVRRILGKPSTSFPKLNFKKWLLVNLHINKMPNIHIVDRYMKSVLPLGVTNDGKGLEFYLSKKDMIDPASVSPLFENPYVAMVIGGQHATKIFPAKKASQLIDKINKPVILLGGPEDRERGSEIITQCHSVSVFNACGELSLGESSSIVQQAVLVITNDTGLMHVAAAFEKPVVSIWGNTVPELGMYPYIPGRKDLVIMAEVKGLRCRPCSKLGYQKCPKGHFRCMMNQNIDNLAKDIESLWQRNI